MSTVELRCSINYIFTRSHGRSLIITASLLQVEMERRTITFELDTVKNGPNSDMWTTDLVHQAAYRSNTLGLPSLCPEENICKIDREELMDYMATYYHPSRMVLAGVNVNHDRFVELAQSWFGEPNPMWGKREGERDGADHSLSQYTGGDVKVTCYTIYSVIP